MNWLSRLITRNQSRHAWPPARWQATHQHRKGGLYRVIGPAVAEADRSEVIIYDDAQGAVWVRARDEFYDGRFTPV